MPVTWGTFAKEADTILKSLLTAAGDIIYATGASTPARLAKGANGEVLTLAAGLPSWEEAAAAGLPDAVVGDVLEISADAEALSNSDAYEKEKEIILGRGGAYRVKFYMRTDPGEGTVYARVYKNGVAVGTEQSHNTDTYTIKSEDIAGWARGDLCQLYLRKGTAWGCYARNFRLYTETPIIGAVLIN